MAVLRKLNLLRCDRFLYFCIACNTLEWFDTKQWHWDRDMDCPTVHPDIKYEKESYICHKRITNGVIEYLPDCTHAMAGMKANMEVLDW